jgi:hypothetical protein
MVKELRVISLQAFEMDMTENHRAGQALYENRRRLREIEIVLLHKKKALTEAAALLIRREKFSHFRNFYEEEYQYQPVRQTYSFIS